MIHLHSVTKVYPPEQSALSGIDLRIGEGEFIFLAGASGAGKSTLLKLLYGAEKATTGEVLVGGRNLGLMDANSIAALRREMGIVFQDFKLLPRRSVVDNVAYGLEVQGVEAKERRRLAMKVLGAIGLEDRTSALPPTLSGGEQQRVAIARALLHHPRILIADEPTGNLDPEMSRAVFDLLMEASSGGVTVIVATHNLGIIEEFNLRTVILDRGKVLGDFEKPGGLE